MQLETPKYYNILSHDKQEEWKRIIAIMQEVDRHFEVKAFANPHLSSFHIIKDKRKPFFFKSWQIFDQQASFILCLMEFETVYGIGGSHGESIHEESHKYFYGYLRSKQDFGHTLIRPETLGDKITELFQPIEIDIEGYPRFNRKYYVLSNDKEKFIKAAQPDFLNYLGQTKDLQLEFNGNACLFRLPKSLDTQEALRLCSIGIRLDKILNS